MFSLRNKGTGGVDGVLAGVGRVRGCLRRSCLPGRNVCGRFLDRCRRMGTVQAGERRFTSDIQVCRRCARGVRRIHNDCRRGLRGGRRRLYMRLGGLTRGGRRYKRRLRRLRLDLGRMRGETRTIQGGVSDVGRYLRMRGRRHPYFFTKGGGGRRCEDELGRVASRLMGLGSRSVRYERRRGGVGRGVRLQRAELDGDGRGRRGLGRRFGD